MDRDDLKIEFRAVPYFHEEHVLEYRISPEQDLFETLGAFEKYIAEREKSELERYWRNRKKYLEDRNKIYY